MGFWEEHKIRMKNLLDKLTNDAHVPIALFVFVVTSAYHFHTGKDLGANYTSSLYAFYGFLGGHALVYQKWPDKTDKDGDGIPDAQEDHGPLPDPAPPAPKNADTGGGG
jgi:hypothetical protein